MAAAKAGAGREAPTRRPRPGPSTPHRHVTVVHVVGQGPLVPLDQDAKTDAAVAIGPFLHDARRVAKTVPVPSPDLPSRVRVGLRVVGSPVLHGATPAKGKPYAVLVGPILMGLVRPDLPAPAATAITDRRGRAPAGNASIGPFTEEAAPGTVVDAKVGLTVRLVPRPVVVEVVATRMAAAATDHPPLQVPPRPRGVADLASPNLRQEEVIPTRGLEGNDARLKGHGLAARPHAADRPTLLAAVGEAAGGVLVARRPLGPETDLGAVVLATGRPKAGLATSSPVAAVGRGARLPIRRQVADVAATDGRRDLAIPTFPAAGVRQIEGPIDQGGTAAAGEGHRPEAALEGARVHLVTSVTPVATPAPLAAPGVAGTAPIAGAPVAEAIAPASAARTAVGLPDPSAIRSIAIDGVEGPEGARQAPYPGQGTGLPRASFAEDS